ncbi:MAG: transcription antitermination factor NusB [Candidatus Nanopelagicales bacterium]|nr:transcription antitermination factor NusB [Candidatus Nanopelagicales bacterium]MDZ4249377.1 transcription antitermination factor NusB [Candidatus Nanopelagicales bacterium]
MSARGKARRRALDILFEADIRRMPALDVLADQDQRQRGGGPVALNPYTVELVTGVVENLERIDELITTYSVDWSLDRMPPVDLNLLRIGAYEILWREDIPDEVAVAEAVSMAKELSTDESGSFVNGLLARLMAVRPGI